MDSRAVIGVLRSNRDRLRKMGVCHAALFGSTARAAAGPNSDIDIMVEIAPDAKVGVYEYVGIVQFLESLFPEPVDVSNRAAQKPHVRASAEREAIYAF
jgi:predicted nucleotidyltransferase